ncbi:hypothetical protein N2605_17490 [Bradyrhizobium yuanmingense]|uniref:hypothetical protein n=1 Tax=Bradyrhizobium yuanmingense TaxID=108015 RepID=UPI0021A4B057|nr:hypothetical protein [Bradyrhizobium sp. CB1024]UWU88165.1 hypothetical protein N2605_17490 [Bradyrhizobium sp. CB1024]
MTQWLARVYAPVAAIVAVAVGWATARYVPLSMWKPVFPGMLVALSMLGAAVLVRLARNAPITAPTAFDETDLKRFFDALEELNRRLFWIFLQAVMALFITLFAIVMEDHKGMIFGYAPPIAKVCSGILGFLLVWILSRVLAMARGDIGFVRLQREVLENALARQRKAASEKIVPATVEFRSSGGYGRAL